MRNDFGSKFVLNCKDVLNTPIVAIRPKMRATTRIDQLRHDAELIAGAPCAPFDNVARTQS